MNHSEATGPETRSPLGSRWTLWGTLRRPRADSTRRWTRRPARRSSRTALALLVLSSTGPAAGEAREIRLPAPGQPEWQAIEFARIEAHTRYEAVTPSAPERETVGVGDESLAPRGPACHSHAACSASGMFLPIDGVDLEATPMLSWSWKIVQGLDIADEKIAGGDDFAARVYALYRFDRSQASLLKRLAHDISCRLAGRELPGATINYVWTSHVPVGESWTLPGSASTIRLSLRSDSFLMANADALESDRQSGVGWQSERVDLLADYARLVRDGDPPELAGIAIMTDSDDTCQEASALFGPMSLSARAAHEKSPRQGSQAEGVPDRHPAKRADSASSTRLVSATLLDEPPEGRGEQQNPASAP